MLSEFCVYAIQKSVNEIAYIRECVCVFARAYSQTNIYAMPRSPNVYIKERKCEHIGKICELTATTFSYFCISLSVCT